MLGCMLCLLTVPCTGWLGCPDRMLHPTGQSMRAHPHLHVQGRCIQMLLAWIAPQVNATISYVEEANADKAIKALTSGRCCARFCARFL